MVGFMTYLNALHDHMHVATRIFLSAENVFSIVEAV